MKPNRPVFVLSLGAASILLTAMAAGFLFLFTVFYQPFRESGIETPKPYLASLISVASVAAGFIAWVLGGETVNNQKESGASRVDAALAKIGYGLGVVGTVIGSTMTLIYLFFIA